MSTSNHHENKWIKVASWFFPKKILKTLKKGDTSIIHHQTQKETVSCDSSFQKGSFIGGQTISNFDLFGPQCHPFADIAGLIEGQWWASQARKKKAGYFCRWGNVAIGGVFGGSSHLVYHKWLWLVVVPSGSGCSSYKWLGLPPCALTT